MSDVPPYLLRFDDDELPDEPPAGFEPYTHSGPYSSRNGPFYFKEDPERGHIRAFRVRKRHCNGADIVHGGCLMAFADGVMGHKTFHATKAPTVTIRMNSDFLSSARAGDWVEGRAMVTRATRSVVFVEAEIYVAERPILHCSGIFKVMRRRRVKGE